MFSIKQEITITQGYVTVSSKMCQSRRQEIKVTAITNHEITSFLSIKLETETHVTIIYPNRFCVYEARFVTLHKNISVPKTLKFITVLDTSTQYTILHHHSGTRHGAWLCLLYTQQIALCIKSRVVS